jgi:hypothetical protein
MTNNEPLGGNLNDDGNANGTASSAAHPVDAADLRDSGETTGHYDDVDFGGTDADGGDSHSVSGNGAPSHAAPSNGSPHVERADAGTDAFGAGTAGVGDGTTGLTTGVGNGSPSSAPSNGSPSSAAANGSPSSAGASGGSNLGDLGDPSHPFDQTNGIVEGLEGDSDEADAGDTTPA